MKILKYLFFFILLIFITGALYFGTKDGNYDIKDTAIIKAPIEMVFNQVNDLKNWEHWGPWKKEDSTMVFTYGNKTQGEGAYYSWKGQMDGAMKTTKVIENKEILQDLTLFTPAGERNPEVYWKFETVPDGTKVTWGMTGEHTLIDKMFYTFSSMDFEKNMHDMNNKGLKGIKEEVKKEMNQYTIKVQGIKEYGGGYYLYKTASSKIEDIGLKIAPMMNEVQTFMLLNEIPQTGMPFTIYNQIDAENGTVIFSTCIPVNEKILTKKEDPVLCGFMEQTNAVKTSLLGNYKHLTETYVIANQYIKEHHLIKIPNQAMFEMYSNDPSKVKNPAQWRTEVYIPVFKDLKSNHPLITKQN
ncbi:MAG: SRPBCC family protein [Flavobacteriales bacterium]